MDFLAADEKLGLEPISYLIAQREREPCEAVVLSEIRSRDYAAVLLVTGRRRGSWLTRGLHLDPVHRLRRHLGRRLVVFPLGDAALKPTFSSWSHGPGPGPDGP